MTALHELGAAALAALYRGGQASPVEATQAVLDHIQRWEPQLKALYAHDPEVALQMARASEQRWRSSQPLSALDGVPCTIKENIATRGVGRPPA